MVFVIDRGIVVLLGSEQLPEDIAFVKLHNILSALQFLGKYTVLCLVISFKSFFPNNRSVSMRKIILITGIMPKGAFTSV